MDFKKFKIIKQNKILKIEPSSNDGDNEIVSKNSFNSFFNVKNTSVIYAGIAVGIQHVLKINDDYYWGIRTKHDNIYDIQISGTNARISLGAYNTGYQLIKTESQYNNFSSGNFHDSFHVQNENVRQYFPDSTELSNMFGDKYSDIRNLMELRIDRKNNENKENNKNEENNENNKYQALVFGNIWEKCNNPDYFPRLEIGVLKITEVNTDNIHIPFNYLTGIGCDLYAYKFQESNYWLWFAKDQNDTKSVRIAYRSYRIFSDMHPLERREGENLLVNNDWFLKFSHNSTTDYKTMIQVTESDNSDEFDCDEDMKSGDYKELAFPARALVKFVCDFAV